MQTMPRAGHAREPNVVPMIDVLLTLIIIFMLLQIKRTHHDLQLPQPSTATVSAPSVTLDVRPGPIYAIGGRTIPIDSLGAALSAIFDGRRERVLFVKGDPSVRYQDVYTTFGIARGAGVTVTGVLTAQAMSK